MASSFFFTPSPCFGPSLNSRESLMVSINYCFFNNISYRSPENKTSMSFFINGLGRNPNGSW